jgi:hypothetical protein
MSLFLISSSLFAFLIGIFVGHDLSSLTFITAGCVLFNFGLNTLLWRLDRRYLIYKFFAVWFVYQPIFLFLLLIIFPTDMQEQVFTFLPVDGGFLSLFASFCVVPLFSVLLALAIDKSRGAASSEAFNYSGQRIKPAQSSFRLPALGTDFNVMLIICAFISVTIWVSTTMETSHIAFFFRVLYRGLFFMPFVAGLYWNRSKLVQLVWWGCLTMNMGLAFLTGSRGYGFLPLGCYGLGFIVQQTTRSRRFFWITIGLSCTVPLILLGGLIQVLRDDVGRTSLTSMHPGEVLQDIDAASGKSLQNNVNTWDAAQNNALWIGLSRLLDWSLVAVPNMSPEIVPYRGYADYFDELESMLSIPGLGIFPDLGFNSVMLAVPYGFNVYLDSNTNPGFHGGTTVPFNMVADSWSRGGLFSLAIQVSTALIILLLLEKLLYQWFIPRQVCLFVLGRTVLAGLAFNYFTNTILSDSVRQCITTFGFTLICIGLPTMFFSRTPSGGSSQAEPLIGSRTGFLRRPLQPRDTDGQRPF